MLNFSNWCECSLGYTARLYCVHFLYMCGKFIKNEKNFKRFLIDLLNLCKSCKQGGLRAVVWTDVIQTVIMFGAILLVIIKGTIDVGGISTVWERAWDSGRIETPR